MALSGAAPRIIIYKGYFEGTKAIDIKVGDVLVWNYGLLSKVISKEISDRKSVV